MQKSSRTGLEYIDLRAVCLWVTEPKLSGDLHCKKRKIEAVNSSYQAAVEGSGGTGVIRDIRGKL